MRNTSPVIEGGYLHDILDQPPAMERTVQEFVEDPELAAIGERFRNGRYRHVVLTGMGSSFHAFHPLLLELTELGLPVVLVETSELIHYRSRLLAPDALTIVLSQSGRSVETIRLLELNAGRSVLVAVTNAPDSPLCAAANTSVVMHAGREHSVSSKTYLASLAALAWLGDHLTGAEPGRSREELSRLAPAIAAYLAQWREYVACARNELEGIERVYYVGRGPSLATVGAAGLTTKESARFPAEGMSAAAFRHGPLEMVDRRLLLLVFEGDPRTGRLNHGLASDVKMAGGRAAVIRETAEAGLFHTPPVPPRLRPVVEMLPVQMITLALAAMAGHEAGAFALASKVTLTE
jgi:glucosamine--fructose-6-phosphate aminotransferase (isomerizing)